MLFSNIQVPRRISKQILSGTLPSAPHFPLHSTGGPLGFLVSFSTNRDCTLSPAVNKFQQHNSTVPFFFGPSSPFYPHQLEKNAMPFGIRLPVGNREEYPELECKLNRMGKALTKKKWKKRRLFLRRCGIRVSLRYK